MGKYEYLPTREINFYILSLENLFTTLCKYLFLKVTVKAVTKLDNKAAHFHTSVLKGHCSFL